MNKANTRQPENAAVQNSAGQADSGSAAENMPAAEENTVPAKNLPAEESAASQNTAAQPVILMRDVKKTYQMGEQYVYALRGLNFSVQQGEFLSIMGPSGSGKSTCMNMIGCLDRPTSGVVEVGGKPTASMTERELAVLRNQTIGFVFQQYHLLPSMTVLENVMLPLRYKGIAVAERRVLAAKALERVGLGDRMAHRPYELSGGQKQRVAIARATVTEPRIILADEPTGALDSETGRAVLDLFAEINRTGTTIVIVTHDPRIGESTPRCIRIFDGLIQSDVQQTPVPFGSNPEAAHA